MTDRERLGSQAPDSGRESLILERLIQYEDTWVKEISGKGGLFHFSHYKDAFPSPGNEVLVETWAGSQIPEPGFDKTHHTRRRSEITDCLYVFTDDRHRTLVYSDIDTQRGVAVGMQNPIRAAQVKPGENGVHIPGIIIGEPWEVAGLPRSAPVTRVLVKMHEAPEHQMDSGRIHRESPFAALREELQEQGIEKYLGQWPLRTI